MDLISLIRELLDMFDDFDPKAHNSSTERDKLLEKFADYLLERCATVPPLLRPLLDREWVHDSIDDLLDLEGWTRRDLAKLAALFIIAISFPET